MNYLGEWDGNQNETIIPEVNNTRKRKDMDRIPMINDWMHSSKGPGENTEILSCTGLRKKKQSCFSVCFVRPTGHLSSLSQYGANVLWFLLGVHGKHSNRGCITLPRIALNDWLRGTNLLIIAVAASERGPTITHSLTRSILN